MDVHLDKLVAKGMIGSLLLGDQSQCAILFLLIPGIQSGQLLGVPAHCPSQ